MSTKIHGIVALTLLLFNIGGIASAQNPAFHGVQNHINSTDTWKEIGGSSNPSSDLQFTASGHVIQFTPSEIILASADHALNIEFVGANRVNPVAAISDTTQAAQEHELLETPSASWAKPLRKVTYTNLWEGVTLDYQRSKQGLVKSTYRIDPPIQEHLAQIHLRYNTGIELLPEGSLAFKFATGQMIESAPIAWQEVGSQRASVQTVFRQLGERDTGFALQGKFDPALPLVIDPLLMWTSFLGASGDDWGQDMAVDGSGNLYVIGFSSTSWDSPVDPLSGDYDVFVAKLDDSGMLLWNTFLGSTDRDTGYAIAVDSGGNSYLAGSSLLSWGGAKTVNPHSAGNNSDGFVAKLDSSGALVWNTFLGSDASWDVSHAIALDGDGNIYVGGSSTAAWGASPVNAYSDDDDGFCAKLDNDGVRQWHTFLGSDEMDVVEGIAIDESGAEPAIYLAGASEAEWGTPGSYKGGFDAFLARLNGSGVRQWNIFLGSTSTDWSYGVAVDGSGNAYLTGNSMASWGSPLNAHPGGIRVFTAKISNSGLLIWNTFLDMTVGYDIALDGSGNLYLTGICYGTWGTPVNPYAGQKDAYAVRLNSSGVLQWHTYLGSTSSDDSYGIAVAGGNVYVAGYSQETWGSPVNPFAAGFDAFAAKLNSMDGVRTWNTFLGAKNSDYVSAIALDASGNIYVAGYSNAPWGSPANAFSGGWDAFAAKLNNQGVLQWSTFLGSPSDDYAYGIAVYGSNVYVAGASNAAWGTGTHIAGWDAFTAKLNASNGGRQWNVFLGTIFNDYGNAIAADSTGIYLTGSLTTLLSGSNILVAKLDSSGGITWSINLGSTDKDFGNAIVTNGSGRVYVAGKSFGAWGSDPVNDYHADYDAVIAALASSNGALQWNTFLGSSLNDFAYGIDLDGSGNIYLAGTSSASWGNPVNEHAGAGINDAFAASLYQDGTLRWNTFMGSSQADQGYAVSVGHLGDSVYVAGLSEAAWGTPIYPNAGENDAFLAQFDSDSGERDWNLFLGSTGDDEGQGIAVDTSGWIYLAGSSQSVWKNLLFNYGINEVWDGFISRLAPYGLILPIVMR